METLQKDELNFFDCNETRLFGKGWKNGHNLSKSYLQQIKLINMTKLNNVFHKCVLIIFKESSTNFASNNKRI